MTDLLVVVVVALLVVCVSTHAALVLGSTRDRQRLLEGRPVAPLPPSGPHA